MKLSNNFLALLMAPLLFVAPACDDGDDDDMMEIGETGSGGTDSDGSGSGGGSGTGDGSGTGNGGGTGDGSGTGNGSGTGDGSGTGNDSDSDGSGGSGGHDDLGDPCKFSDECSGEVCLLSDGDEFGYCSQVCVDWTDCPDFWDCIELDNASFSACAAG